MKPNAVDVILATNPRYAGGTYLSWDFDSSNPLAHHDVKFGNYNHAGCAMLVDAKLNAAKAIVAEPAITALEGLLVLFMKPGEGSLEAYERMAEQFDRETGMMAPGKSQSPHDNLHSHEEREKGWQQWRDKKIAAAFAALTAWRELQS